MVKFTLVTDSLLQKQNHIEKVVQEEKIMEEEILMRPDLESRTMEYHQIDLQEEVE